MNVKGFIPAIGSGIAAAVVLYLLIALPEQAVAGSGQIKVTHAQVPYKTSVQTAASTTKVQSTVKQAKSSEIQVGVMPEPLPGSPTRPSVYIHR